jgi:beta-hydroxylase
MENQHEIFPFLRKLEDNYRAVREEVITILYNETVNQKAYFKPWPQKDIFTGEWDVFRLYAFGEQWVGNCKKCPVTTSFLQSIPGVVNAAFSSIAVGTHIDVHTGHDDSTYRCHLGLMAPEQNKLPTDTVFQDKSNRCGMQVEEKFFHWEEGKAFVFDDTQAHETWNYGDRTRIVLLIDFKRPEPGLPLEQVSTFYTDAVNTTL